MQMLNINNVEYPLELTIGDFLLLEKSIGQNPLNLITDVMRGKLPTMTECIKILYYSMPGEKRGNFDVVQNLFGEYIKAGNGINDFVLIAIDIFKEGGYTGKN